MKTKHYLYRIALFCGILLLFACDKNSASSDLEPDRHPQLVLTASSSEVSEGDEITFSITADNKSVVADIYIDNEKIDGDKWTFEQAGSYKVIAKKSGYLDSENLQITVNESDVSHEVDIYVVGLHGMTIQEATSNHGEVWKNGETLYTLENLGRAVGNVDIALHNDDVYVVGTRRAPRDPLGWTASYWKNNVVADFPSTTANGSSEVSKAVFSENDMYAIGSGNNGHIAAYWKNFFIHPVESGSTNVYAKGLAVENENLYIVGHKTVRNSSQQLINKIVLWKNGIPADITGTQNNALALDVAVENGSIYLLGRENDHADNNKYTAKYWINGEPKALVESINVDVYPEAIAVKDGDVYVCGGLVDPNSNKGFRAMVWKNGERLYELTDGTYTAEALDIAIDGNDIYVVGYEKSGSQRTDRNIAKVWKNGEVLYALTDGTRHARAFSLAIKRK